MHGPPSNVLTLYTQSGEPVDVHLVDGAYRLVTYDVKAHEALLVLIEKVTELAELVAERD